MLTWAIIGVGVLVSLAWLARRNHRENSVGNAILTYQAWVIIAAVFFVVARAIWRLVSR